MIGIAKVYLSPAIKFRSSIFNMFFIRCGYVKVLLLTVTLQCFASVHSNGVLNKHEGNLKKVFVSFQDAASNLINLTRLHEHGSPCTRDVKILWESVAVGEDWALQMFDAASKVQSGILKGNIRDMGMYDQCLAVGVQRNPANVSGSHCMVTLSVPPELFDDVNGMLVLQKLSIFGQNFGSPLTFTSAVCLPSSCNDDDVLKLINRSITATPSIAMLGIKVDDVICSSVKNDDFSLGEIVLMMFIVTIVAFLLFCTVCEYLQRGRPNGEASTLSTLAEFSLYTNSRNLLSTKPAPDAVPVIFGIRVLSLCWVVLVHRTFVTFFGPIANTNDALAIQSTSLALFCHMVTFMVDLAFLVGGFLTSRQLVKSIRKGEKINLPLVYIHRYIRLTPSLAIVTLVTMFFLRRIGSGAMWDQGMKLVIDPCKENWWTNLLYIQTSVNSAYMCLPHTWYLASEMKHFIASRILILASFRWPKYARSILTVSFLLSILAPCVLLVINENTNAVFKLRPETSISELQNNVLGLYMSSVFRSSAYLVGVILGYIDLNVKKSLTKSQIVIGWALAGLAILLCTLATRYVYADTYEYNLAFEVLYTALARPACAIAMAWFIFACTQGHGGPIARFLSSPIFLPLSRLSYCIHLVHIVMQMVLVLSLRMPFVFSKFALVHQFWGDLVVSTALGFLLSLFFETPMIVLERVIKKSFSPKVTSTGEHLNGILKLKEKVIKVN